MKIQQFIYKNRFAKALNIHRNTLQSDLLKMEPKIKEIFPEYSRHSQLLPPKLANFLMEHYGLEPNDLTKKEQ